MKNLRRILASEGLLKSASEWKDLSRGEMVLQTPIGRYSFRPAGTSYGRAHPAETFFIPAPKVSDVFGGTLKHPEFETFAEAKKWAEGHFEANKDAKPYVHENSKELLTLAKRVEKAVAKLKVGRTDTEVKWRKPGSGGRSAIMIHADGLKAPKKAPATGALPDPRKLAKTLGQALGVNFVEKQYHGIDEYDDGHGHALYTGELEGCEIQISSGIFWSERKPFVQTELSFGVTIYADPDPDE